MSRHKHAWEQRREREIIYLALYLLHVTAVVGLFRGGVKI